MGRRVPLGRDRAPVRRRNVTGFLSRLLGRPDARAAEDEGAREAAAERQTALEEPPEGASPPDPDGPAVVAYLKLSDPEFVNEREQMRLFALEDRVMAAIDQSGTGTYEGNYVDRGFFRLYASGPDADRLAEVMRPLVSGVAPGSVLVIRRGPSGTEEERVRL